MSKEEEQRSTGSIVATILGGAGLFSAVVLLGHSTGGDNRVVESTKYSKGTVKVKLYDPREELVPGAELLLSCKAGKVEAVEIGLARTVANAWEQEFPGKPGPCDGDAVITIKDAQQVTELAGALRSDFKN